MVQSFRGGEKGDTFSGKIQRPKHEDDEAIQDTFDSVDIDDSGGIDHEEFEKALTRIGINPSDAKALFDTIDVNGDGEINFTEFRDWVKNGRSEWASNVAKKMVADVPTYQFTYGFLRDVTYRNMLFQQRQRIHQYAAQYYGRNINDMWHQSRSYDPKLQVIGQRHCVFAGDAKDRARESWWNERAYKVFQATKCHPPNPSRRLFSTVILAFYNPPNPTRRLFSSVILVFYNLQFEMSVQSQNYTSFLQLSWKIS